MPDEIVTPPETTTTAPPVTIPTDNTSTLELYDRILAEKQQEINALREQANRTPPTPEVPVDSAAYFQDPMKHISDLMDKKLAESTGPLNEFVLQQRRKSALDNYRNIAASDPRVVKFWPHISAKFDQLGAKWIEKNDVNEAIVVDTIRSLIAEFAMTSPLEYAKLIGTPVETPPTPNKPVIPPSIPPSANEPPVNADPNKTPTLSENEMRLARERWPNLPHAEAYKKYDSLRNPGSFVVVPKEKK